LTHARSSSACWRPRVTIRTSNSGGWPPQRASRGLRADRATCQSTLQQASQAVHPFTLAESQAQSSAQVESQLQQAVATLNTSMPPIRRATIKRRSPNSSAKFPDRALVDAWWLGRTPDRPAGARRTDPKVVPAATAPVVYWQAQVEKNKTPALKRLSAGVPPGPGALLQHPLTAT